MESQYCVNVTLFVLQSRFIAIILVGCVFVSATSLSVFILVLDIHFIIKPPLYFLLPSLVHILVSNNFFTFLSTFLFFIHRSLAKDPYLLCLHRGKEDGWGWGGWRKSRNPMHCNLSPVVKSLGSGGVYKLQKVSIYCMKDSKSFIIYFFSICLYVSLLFPFSIHLSVYVDHWLPS